MINCHWKSVALFLKFRMLISLSLSSTLTYSFYDWIFPKKKINILTQLLGSRSSFMAGMGAKKIIISCTGAHKRKKCGIQKDKKWVVKFLACPVFELRMLIMLKRVSCIACTTSVYERVILKRTRNRLKHYFGSIENGAEVFVY